MIDRTHWDGCWRDHHECAIAHIERLEQERRDEVERLENELRILLEQAEAALGYTGEKRAAYSYEAGIIDAARQIADSLRLNIAKPDGK